MGKRWANVQDLSPFGWKILGRYWTRGAAERAAAISPYRQVMTVDEAQRRDADCVQGWYERHHMSEQVRQIFDDILRREGEA